LTLFYEDFEIGSEFTSSERIVSQEDMNRFASLTGDMNRLHIDEEYAKTTIFLRPIAHGMLTLSIALGLWYSMDLTRNSIVAFLGINNLAFKRPVYAGDRLHLFSKVLSRRESKSKPDEGIVTFKDQMLNSSGDIVMESERTLLLKRKKEN
jgi:3-hydroxybutyryl-CoA dehydratase